MKDTKKKENGSGSVRKGKESRGAKVKVSFNILTNTKGKYYVQIKFSNGRIFSHSEDYSSQGKAAESLKEFLKYVEAGQFAVSV